METVISDFLGYFNFSSFGNTLHSPSTFSSRGQHTLLATLSPMHEPSTRYAFQSNSSTNASLFGNSNRSYPLTNYSATTLTQHATLARIRSLPISTIPSTLSPSHTYSSSSTTSEHTIPSTPTSYFPIGHQFNTLTPFNQSYLPSTIPPTSYFSSHFKRSGQRIPISFYTSIESSKGIYSTYMCMENYTSGASGAINIVCSDYLSISALNKYSKNVNLADLIAILGSIDFVLGSVDM